MKTNNIMPLAREKNKRISGNLKLPASEKCLITETKNIQGIIKKNTQPQKTKMNIIKSNVILRTLFTFIMITAFLFFVRLEKIYLIVLIYVLKTLSLREIVSILNVNIRKNVMRIRLLSWYLILVCDYYLLGKTLSRIYMNDIIKRLMTNHVFYCFTLYIAGIVFFILNLEKRELRKQFAYFGLMHFVIYIIGLACILCIMNINYGKVWFVYPCSLVICNDIFAYIFGRLLGRTPLIKLSPKKTWEGFLGGLIATIFFGLFVVYIKINYFDISDLPNLLCEEISINLFNFIVNIKKVYLHSFAFILFASLIAPFGGFFASGFKRAFNVKDFGECIPGHGGFVDRFDCQFLMGVFTNVYYFTFILEKYVGKEKLFRLIVKHLNRQEIGELVSMLNEYN